MALPGTSTDRPDDFARLDRGGRALAALARRPGRGVLAGLFLLVAAAWALLAAMAAELAAVSPPGSAGPGAGLLKLLPSLPLPAAVETFLALCLAPAQGGAGGAAFVALTGMWLAMSVAMMLPSAAPMLSTYCEIADTAAGKGEAAVHPLVLAAGYLAVWLAAAAGFAAGTMALAAAGREAGLDPLRGAAGAAALAVAGLYQFSRLKEACLEKCRNPFSVLFARWSARPGAIFGLGVEQGIWCLGCCWALMLVMFAVGIMNPFWMALLAVLAAAEKTGRGRALTRLAGAILLVWAAALLVLSL